MRRIVILLPILVACLTLFIASCGKDVPETVTLVDFDFRDLTADPIAPTALAEPNWGLHWLQQGWDDTPDSAQGIWGFGPEAHALLELTGRNVVVHLVLSTQPELSAAGQTVEVLLNDHTLGRIPLPDGWKDHVWQATVPDEVLRRGTNRLTLRPEPWSRKGTPYGVYLRQLSVVADLGGRERKEWDRRLALPEPDGAWALGTSETASSSAPTEAADAPADARAESPGAGPAAADRPDVLMVLFDATRTAHVGCYGYERPTTPNVDALAAEGLVMQNCFAESPFTIVSVPTLLTGKHWREHGVLGKGQALADSFTTLAEVFGDAGYLTLGYSGNPFVSHGTQLSQGFVEFTELWNDPAHQGMGRSAELGERRFLERTRAGLDDRPVFAYLHLMPPHSPYFPGPEHDLWSDPDYDGIYDGSADQLTRIEEEELTVSEADRGRIVALYDGNLHRIDASLGRIVAGWRALERTRDLLIVVVSDHGEAFGEHGHWEHLNTVHDEMTHVPLVLWPRSAWAELEPARETVVSLADVYPLLLRRAGLPLPADHEWTCRARDIHAGPRVEPAEVIIRTTLTARTFGLRTERYLAVFDGFTDQGLYDLEIDPGARRNLRAEQPDLYVEMLGRLRAVLTDRAPVKAQTYQPTEQEIKTLESLGY